MKEEAGKKKQLKVLTITPLSTKTASITQDFCHTDIPVYELFNSFTQHTNRSVHQICCKMLLWKNQRKHSCDRVLPPKHTSHCLFTVASNCNV